jgi:hypothetical protein
MVTIAGLPRLLRAALVAAGRGWPVFPLIPGGKRPAITGWPHQATVDADVLAVWWRAVPYNVAIACEPAGLLVVDLDGPRGHSSFTELDAGIELVPTFTVATPSGGQHRYYTVEPGTPAPSTVARLGTGIDTRGAGGYVVAPGSVRSIDRRWRCYRIIDPTPPAALPDGIASRLHPSASAPVPWSRRPQHHRYGRAAVTGECGLIRAAHPGTRNAVLFRAGVRLGTLVGTGVLDEQDVHCQLRAAASVHNGIDGFTIGEAERAIANGLRYGRARPRQSLQP